MRRDSKRRRLMKEEERKSPEKVKKATSLVVQGLRHHAYTAGSIGSILVGELRSHMPHGTIKKTEKVKDQMSGGFHSDAYICSPTVSIQNPHSCQPASAGYGEGKL